MAAVVSSHNMMQTFDDYSRSYSQASSPASPTASFQNQQIPITLPSINLNGTSRTDGVNQPSTPTSNHSSPTGLEPPPGMSYAEYLRTWSDIQVARWLAEHRCGQHAQTFRTNDIRGDILLELDQATLKEMGLTSVGDRLRIVSAVKGLRQKCSPSISPSLANRQRNDRGRNGSVDLGLNDHGGRPTRRLDSGRPAPLHLSPASNSNDLPRLIRDGPDSARPGAPVIRPLPQPTSSTSNGSSTSTHTPGSRSALPPLPPPPKGQPPQPPNGRPSRSHLPLPNPLSGRRTPVLPDAPSFTNQPLPPAPSNQNSVNWPSYDIQSGRPPLRSPSPLQSQSTVPSRSVNRSPNSGSSSSHGRNSSYSGSSTPTQGNPPKQLPPRPSNTSPHPYATSAAQQNNLSPIHESFTSQRAASGTPPPGSQYRVGGGPFLRPNTPSHIPSLDDLRRKLIKFTLPDEGKSTTINAVDCAGGAEVLEKALKKFGKLTSRSGDDGHILVEIVKGGGLSVEGWGVFLEWNTWPGDDPTANPLTEAQILSICHAPPDNPARENGLILRQLSPSKSPRFPPSDSHSDASSATLAPPNHDPYPSLPTPKATKRASSISILSSLGVPIAENPPALLSPSKSPSQSPAKKLRNKLRPPSELISTHLPEYFPNADKKVLERTRRQSMMRATGTSRRDSVMSLYPPSRSRFSISTQNSHRSTNSSPRNSIISTVGTIAHGKSPTPSELAPPEATPPRVSISTEDGRSIIVNPADQDETPTALQPVQYLPPVAFPSESLAESMNLTEPLSRRVSRAMSTASKRMSYITELRSKRDKSDTASMMTVDEITAEVESRRASMESRRASMILKDSDGSEEWTTVDVDEDAKSMLEAEDLDDDEEEDEDEIEEESDVTITDDEEDDEQGKLFTSHGELTIKWIKGALIGSGSFGKVYLGMDASSGLLMAVKQVELPTGSAPNEERKKSMLSALEREIELLKVLHHENIVQYLSSCVDEDHLNIFLEYVPGGSVTSLLQSYGAFEEPLVRNWVRQILTGLNYLHERDIIHRDIKGANMLVDNKGGIKISDFGISKKVEETLMPGNRAHRPSLQGSVFWMAPEVVKQTAYTKKADIWSIGCLVVEMLTGEHPWAQLTQMQAIFKIGSSAKPSLPPDVSPEAEDFLNRTFELNHEARPSAAELLTHPWILGAPLQT